MLPLAVIDRCVLEVTNFWAVEHAFLVVVLHCKNLMAIVHRLISAAHRSSTHLTLIQDTFQRCTTSIKWLHATISSAFAPKMYSSCTHRIHVNSIITSAEHNDEVHQHLYKRLWCLIPFGDNSHRVCSQHNDRSSCSSALSNFPSPGSGIEDSRPGSPSPSLHLTDLTSDREADIRPRCFTHVGTGYDGKRDTIFVYVR